MCIKQGLQFCIFKFKSKFVSQKIIMLCLASNKATITTTITIGFPVVEIMPF